MNKKTAINLLGGTPVLAAKAMGYKSSHAIYMWPETLTKPVSDRVLGACQQTVNAFTQNASDKAPVLDENMGLKA